MKIKNLGYTVTDVPGMDSVTIREEAGGQVVTFHVVGGTDLCFTRADLDKFAATVSDIQNLAHTMQAQNGKAGQ